MYPNSGFRKLENGLFLGVGFGFTIEAGRVLCGGGGGESIGSLPFVDLVTSGDSGLALGLLLPDCSTSVGGDSGLALGLLLLELCDSGLCDSGLALGLLLVLIELLLAGVSQPRSISLFSRS